jgi:hypothetical protein
VALCSAVLTSEEHFATAVASLSMGLVRPGIVAVNTVHCEVGRNKYLLLFHRTVNHSMATMTPTPSPRRTDPPLAPAAQRAVPNHSSRQQCAFP